MISEGPSDDVQMRFIEGIPTNDFRNAARNYKTSVNVFAMAILSSALKEYFMRHGDVTTKEITFCSTFNFRDTKATGFDDLDISN